AAPEGPAKMELAAEAVKGAADRCRIAAAEEPRVDQKGIEVVEVAPLLEEAGAERPERRVALEEGAAEGREEGREGELDLGIGVVDRRVDEARDAAAPGQDVAAPHVAMDERGPRRLDEPAV